MAPPLIEIDNLTKDYFAGTQVIHALRGVSLTVAQGEFIAIMGPSGSGKSTMMNLIGCLDTPTSGQYLLDGIAVSSLGPDELADTRNSKIGFVFQNFNLLARTTALQNVALPLLYGSHSRQERRKKAEQVLTEVGLADRMDHHPPQLSGGQQQRVAIARALVNQPALILADEPTGALDTQTGLEIIALFQNLNSRGMTVVIVTHEPDIAKFARRVLRFRDGRLIAMDDNPNPPQAAELLDGFGKGIAA